MDALAEVPSPPLVEDTPSFPPLLVVVLAVLLVAPPAPVALEVPTPPLPTDSSAGSALPQAGANVYDILRRDTFILTRSAVQGLEARLR